MDALANKWVGRVDVFMAWAWMPWPRDGLLAWTLSWVGHGFTGQGMGCSRGCYHCLGTNALANGGVSRMYVVMAWAWMHWPMDGLVAWTMS